jgi:type II secretory pathway pseudopilin PulG
VSVLVILGLLAVMVVQPAMSATLVAKNRIRLSISAADIFGRNSTEQTTDMGSIDAGTLSGSGRLTLPTTFPDDVDTRIRKTSNSTWQLKFDNGEWEGPINVNVDYRWAGGSGARGTVRSTVDPTSRVTVTAGTERVRTRFRRNGSLRWVRGDTYYDIDLSNVGAAGKYTGTLTIEVTFN